MLAHSPEWAARLCDVPAATIRRVANEYLKNACVGETIEIDGNVLPFRPVAVVLGKTVNNGWGGFECCWARTMLAVLVGALEVPGGTLGTTTRLNKPLGNRLASVKPGEDGFMAANFNATDKAAVGGASDWAQCPSHAGAFGRQFGVGPGAGPYPPRLDVPAGRPAALAAAVGARYLVRVP